MEPCKKPLQINTIFKGTTNKLTVKLINNNKILFFVLC